MDVQIFPTYAISQVDSNRFITGTAFLKDGIVYTAGHNFYVTERGYEPEKVKCNALINGKLYLIMDSIFTEYDPNSEDTKRDIALGKIDVSDQQIDTRHISCNESCVLGYSRQELPFTIIDTISWNDMQFHLYCVPITVGTNSFQIPNSHIQISFNNVLFYSTKHAECLHGLSGGPVFGDGTLLGVLISHCFITNNYINSILEGLQRQTNTWRR